MVDRPGPALSMRHMRQENHPTMLDLDTIIGRAKDAPRQTTDVEVLFDAGLAEQVETLRQRRGDLSNQLIDIDADLEDTLKTLESDQRAGDGRAATARAAAEEARGPVVADLADVARQFDDLNAAAAESLVTFRFTALHGFEWNEITARSVAREGVAEDAGRGYNLDEVTRTAATRSGVRVVDDGLIVDVTAEQWAAIWETLPAPAVQQLKMAVWYLNEYAWIQARDEAVVAARKASTARQAATQPSPSTSGSTRGASPAGSPSPSPTTSTTTTAA